MSTVVLFLLEKNPENNLYLIRSKKRSVAHTTVTQPHAILVESLKLFMILNKIAGWGIIYT